MMSVKSVLTDRFKKVIENLSPGTSVEVQVVGKLDTIRAYAYKVRNDLGRTDVRITIKDEKIVFYIPYDAVIGESASLPIPNSLPRGAKSSINVSSGPSRAAAVEGQLITTAKPTVELLDALSVLFACKAVEIVEFIGTTEQEFLSLPNNAKFIGKTTHRGYTIV